MAESVLDIIFRTKKTGDGEGQAKGGLKGLSESFEHLTGVSLTSAASMAALTGAVMGAVKIARDAINEYSSYVESVDKMSMSTGMAAEETSRLIQVADDARVAQSSLETALKMALQNGFQPTIENLAVLSDEYLSMGSATERAEKLQKIFGKQWSEMVPLLEKGGKAIRDGAASISDGLVVTNESIEANRKYVAAVDSLSDSWTNLKYSITRDAIPALSQWMDMAARSIELQESGASRAEWMATMEREKALATYEASDAAQAYSDRLAAQAAVYAEINAQAEESVPVLEDIASGYSAAAAAAERSAAKAHDMASASLDLANAQDALKDAEERWKEGAGGAIANMLEQRVGSGKRYEEGLAAIDAASGTTLLTEERLKDAQQELVNQFSSGRITAEEFEQGIRNLQDAFMPLNEDIQKAKDRIEELRSAVEGVARTWWITVRVRDETGGLLGGGGGGGGGLCFVGSTMVRTPTGLKPISEIQAGDIVILFQEDGRMVEAPVAKTIQGERSDLVRIVTDDGHFDCSPNHLFRINGGWVMAGNLTNRTILRTATYAVGVTRVEKLPGTFPVYNLEVDHREHTYLIGKAGCVVHNAKPVDRAGGGPVYPMQNTIVGEDGPELLTLPPGGGSGWITPNDQLSSAGSGVHFHGDVNINNGLDFEEFMWRLSQRT